MEVLAVDKKRAGELLSLSARTVQRMIRANRIRTVRAGRRSIIPIKALEEFLQVPAHPGPAELDVGRSEGEN